MALLKNKVLTGPFTGDKVRALKAGQFVSLSGTVFTARDKVHKYLSETSKAPVDLKDAVIFHCGPIIIRKDSKWIVQSAGPTTSARYNIYMPKIIEHYRIKVVIGKGGMNDAVRKACKRTGCVYLQLVGGAGAVMAEKIKEVRNAFLKEFGQAESMWELIVENLQAVVAIDANGRSLYRKIERSSKVILDKLLK